MCRMNMQAENAAYTHNCHLMFITFAIIITEHNACFTSERINMMCGVRESTQLNAIPASLVVEIRALHTHMNV
jgi:hypothetical protein